MLVGPGADELDDLICRIQMSVMEPTHVTGAPPFIVAALAQAETASGLAKLGARIAGWWLGNYQIEDYGRGYEGSFEPVAALDVMTLLGRASIDITMRGWRAHLPIGGDFGMQTMERGESFKELVELLEEYLAYIDEVAIRTIRNNP